MKSLLLIRHAKSSWDSPSLSDFDRPLNDRGLRDAPMMAQRILSKKISIDCFVSSTARRAFATAAFFARAYGQKEHEIVRIEALYHALPPTFATVVGQCNDAWQTVALFSHNPGITEYVNQLGIARVDNMPTCGIFGVQAKCDSWAAFAEAEKQFWLFDYPKNF